MTDVSVDSPEPKQFDQHLNVLLLRYVDDYTVVPSTDLAIVWFRSLVEVRRVGFLLCAEK